MDQKNFLRLHIGADGALNIYPVGIDRARRRQPMSLPAEMQWALPPPLIMTNPQVAIAGILEPAYDVAGDSFDYALNDDALHVGHVVHLVLPCGSVRRPARRTNTRLRRAQ